MDVVKNNRRKIEREIAFQINVSHSIIICYLGQIGNIKIGNKWVPHELSVIRLSSGEWR